MSATGGDSSGPVDGERSARAADEGRDDPLDAASDPLELFFDLIYVFAFTRITAFVAHDPTWLGLLRSLGLLAVLWWAWVTYSWLMDTTLAEPGVSERVGVLGASAITFVAALAVPNAFGGTAILFGVAYFAVRALHVGLSVHTRDPEARARFLHLVPGFLGGPALIVAAGFADGPIRAALWIVGIAVDYGVLFVRGVAKFDVHVEHFVERYRAIVVIALGESVLAMGFAIVDDWPQLPLRIVVAAFLGIVLVAALAWLYFDFVTVAAEERLAETRGYERGVFARNSYAYLHFPIVAGIIFVALGLEETVSHAAEPLGTIPAVALYGGCALYLLGHSAFRFHDLGSVSLTRLVVAGVAIAGIPVALRVTSLAALALLAVLLVGLAAFETAYSPIRRAVHDD